jgi:hypothetical protein
LALTPTRIVQADGGETGSKVNVNGYQIALIFAEPATVGENKFHVQITDALDLAVTMAEVEVTAILAENMSTHEDSTASPTSGGDNLHTTSDTHGPGTSALAADTHTDEHAESDDAQHTEIFTSALKPGVEKGEYAGEISLSKPGRWTFTVHFILHGEFVEAKFAIEVAEAGQNYSVLAGFFGFNATVIIAAAVLKRKAASA